jgi:type IV secretion system protein VirB9
MMRTTRLVLLALATGSAVSASATDSRIRTLRYDVNQIVRVPGKANIQSTIEFSADERIESVAVGNSAAWQVTPNHRASLLFIKPLVAWSRTNMTVVTDKRTYMFDLVAGRHEGAPIYSLRFSYPEDIAAKVTAAEISAAPPPPPPAAPPTPVDLNFSWKTKGAADLLPARVFDDGQNLYLSWGRNGPLPAVSTIADDGQEGALNYRVAGDYIVVSPVPSNVSFRYGKKLSTAVRNVPPKPTSPTRSNASSDAQLPSSHPVAAVDGVRATSATAAQSQMDVPSRQVAASLALASTHEGAGLNQKLSYPQLDDERLSDGRHE